MSIVSGEDDEDEVVVQPAWQKSGQIVSGEDDEDDAPAPTVISQKSAVSAQQHPQSPETTAPQVTDTAGLARQVSAVAASGGGRGEGMSAANTSNDAAGVRVTAPASGTVASRPAQRASVKAAATESKRILELKRANVRMQQQLGASIASFLKAPQVDLLGTARLFETSREAAQSAASLLRAVNADLAALTNAHATREMSRWSALVSGGSIVPAASSATSAPPRR